MLNKYIKCAGLSVLLFTGTPLYSQLTENFDNIATLTGSGWFMQNNSTTIGSTGWFQGNATVFAAFNGATTAYIGANYNNTTGTNTISNWLLAPNMTIKNGDVFTFYTRKATPDTYPDRLEFRLSTNGASTNVGATATSVGDFTTLLVSVNPSLVTGVYPVVWTQYSVTISGLSSPVSGRVAFRYFVTNGGPTGANSDYIGIDNFVHTPYVCPTLTVSPGSLPGGTAGTSYSQNLSQTGALGSHSYAVTAGAIPPGLTLSPSGILSGTPSATGTFNFTVTVTDASGCAGSQAYSITIGCPTGGASLSAFPGLCTNGSAYTLVEGSPAGGTYSGTGVSAGVFDPSVGSQNIVYNLIDIYGCPQSASAPITVNNPPAVTLTSFADVCDNSTPFSLSGGSPGGGTFSGTGVSGGMFDPSAGTQTITYSFTDGNGCSNSDSQVQTVLASPSVTLSAFAPVCDNDGMITLSGGSPAGGTYSGTGVMSGDFDPSAGTQTITYTFTDVNTCSSSDMQVQTVNVSPAVSLAPFADVCDNAAPFTLTGESPSGGTFSGTGVSGGMFDPSFGTQLITYDYTDGNGCSNSDSQTINVSGTIPVTLSLSPVCDNDGIITLSGGIPAGGNYNGTGVSAGTFDPSFGTQVITYDYTDGNGCSGSDSQTLTVNTAPVVTLDPFADVCDNDGLVPLSDGQPAGGTYNGTGVSAGMFDASSGTQVITYTYVDGNGCSNSDMQTISVNTSPTVTLAPFTTVLCEGSSPVSLTGGSPAGGTYSGTGVSAGMFTPSTAGVFQITYTFTDANGCSDADVQDITVQSCVGINEVSGITGILCYPNPSNGIFVLEFQSEELNPQINVYNIAGKLVYNATVVAKNGICRHTVDTNGIAPGIYLVKINAGRDSANTIVVIE